jgi:putative flavoprotein involved in K+ transport
MDYYDVVVIGGGWAGLSISYALKQANLRHVVFERGRIGETWRTQRWSSFHMNTPNALTILPGDLYRGPEPEGFMKCAAFIEMLEDYVHSNRLPLHDQTDVEEVRAAEEKFLVRTSSGSVMADALVIASGNLNVLKIPDMSSKLPPSILQLHGVEYRKPEALPDGAVMVVGCGDTGGQIAEELMLAGRQVYLSTGRNGRVPRRYRGRDFFHWMADSKLNQNPRPPGKAGRALVGRTRTISLQSLSANGVVVAGRVRDATQAGMLHFEDTLANSVAYADETSAGVKGGIDAYIKRERIDAPVAELDSNETVLPNFPEPPIAELDLIANDVGTVIWATGLKGNFDWLKVPGTIDTDGEPIQDKSVSVPGVFFAGLDCAESQRAGTVLGAAFEAERIARYLTDHRI